MKTFTYDALGFAEKGPWHVVAMPQGTTVAAFKDERSADDDAADRNQRGTDLAINTRYEVRLASQGTPIRTQRQC